MSGHGLEGRVNVSQTTRALCILRTITGHLDRVGCDVFTPKSPDRDPNFTLIDRVVPGFSPAHPTKMFHVPPYNHPDSSWPLLFGGQGLIPTPDMYRLMREGKLKVTVIQGANIMVTQPQPDVTRVAMANVDFICVIDPYLTETAELADLVADNRLAELAEIDDTLLAAIVAGLNDADYDTELTVVVRKDSAFAGAKSLADLAGAKITGQMSTFHYDMIDQIEGAVKMPAMETFPTMIVAVSSGAIDGYVADRPGAVSATSANADLTYITFDEGQGFTVSPDDAQIAVGVKQGSPLKAQINEILAGISAEERNAIMDAVVLDQPLSE